MSVRRHAAPWTLALAFALCTATVPLSHRWLDPRSAPPHNLTELAEMSRQFGLPLHVVPLRDSSLEEGIYLCQCAQSREELQRLARAAEDGDYWRGVVFCELNQRLGEIDDDEWRRWGEYGMLIGPFVLFGDPALLRRIRQALPES